MTATPPRLEVLAVPGFPEVGSGDDIASLIARCAAAAGIELRDRDVVVVTSKVVSKAEGRLVPGSRDDHLDDETARVVAARGELRIVETRHGFVMAAAGIDASNVPAGHVALLPVDPDASARRIRDGLAANPGVDAGVIVSDTLGRPWRDGLVDVAVGAAGFEVLDDLRGEQDTAGHRLEATVIAVADELAAAADLVKGKLAGCPVAVVRGFPLRRNESEVGAQALVRGAADDMFRLGTREAMQLVVRNSAPLEGTPPAGDAVDEAAVRRAVAALGDLGGVELVVADGGASIAADGPEPLRTGVVVGRLLAALAAEGLRAALVRDEPPTVRITHGPSVSP